jgi:hypothetical protein
MIHSTGMRSNTAVQPNIQGIETPVGPQKRLLRLAVPTQER